MYVVGLYECLIVYLPFCSWEMYSFDLVPSSRLNHTSSLLTVVMMALRDTDTQECQSVIAPHRHPGVELLQLNLDMPSWICILKMFIIRLFYTVSGCKSFRCHRSVQRRKATILNIGVNL